MCVWIGYLSVVPNTHWTAARVVRGAFPDHVIINASKSLGTEQLTLHTFTLNMYYHLDEVCWPSLTSVNSILSTTVSYVPL